MHLNCAILENAQKKYKKKYFKIDKSIYIKKIMLFENQGFKAWFVEVLFLKIKCPTFMK